MRKQLQQKFPGFPPDPITNFWSYPKVMDRYWYMLSGSEQKILDYILRHTWGFDKTDDEISLSQLTKGIKGFDKGTGLSKPTVIVGVRGLVKKGFIKKSVGKYANNYELVKNFNHPSKKSLPFGSKDSLHTIDKDTINNKQYSSFKKKPYYDGYEMRFKKKEDKWYVIKEGNEWFEFGGKEKDIEWK